jgi:hypothetical protein
MAQWIWDKKEQGPNLDYFPALYPWQLLNFHWPQLDEDSNDI